MTIKRTDKAGRDDGIALFYSYEGDDTAMRDALVRLVLRRTPAEKEGGDAGLLDRS